MSEASEQADEIAESVGEDVVSGVKSTTVDGMTVDTIHPMTRLDVADRLRRNASANNPFARMRHARIISPGAGE